MKNSALHSFVVRDATDADSASLLRPVRTSVVERGVRWTIDRESDFFARFRSEAGGWWVVIAEEEDTGTPVGCVSVALRKAYIDGRVEPTCYVINLLVRPSGGAKASATNSAGARSNCVAVPLGTMRRSCSRSARGIRICAVASPVPVGYPAFVRSHRWRSIRFGRTLWAA